MVLPVWVSVRWASQTAWRGSSMILDSRLIRALLDAHDRRLAGFPKRGVLLTEALELLWHGDIGGWRPRKRIP